MRLPMFLAIALIASPARGAPTPVGAVVNWTSRDATAETDYRIGPYQARVGAVRSTPHAGDVDDAWAPQLSLSLADDRSAGVTLTGVEGFTGWTSTQFVAMRLDPASPTVSVVMTSYSGGAHCCMDVQIATPQALGWRVDHLGQFDNEPLYKPPRDLDGDGVVDLMIPDSRFAYRFGCYACSYQPIRVFGLRGGQVVDRTSEPGMRKAVEADLRAAESLCRPGESGACAAYVADAARLGRFDAALKVAVAALPGDKADFPRERCGDRIIFLDCPAAEKRPVRDWATAIRLFLVQTGYLAPKKRP